ncbi:ABC-type sugar transport system [Carbonactinospora thermoautotrophica]|uniref:ABC-type sugar transport system n=1 Tax=Carbonactinospora thermoautotrophica TaxID=1469144 RepID=A0A132MYT8_9ACTN|nr:carbohydrate ABC transporter permease [Carbonactinospora thermoautotrophica]KWX02983.1 ABC-type sugar transport system [Carbonactinospora thermoautotrophica]
MSEPTLAALGERRRRRGGGVRDPLRLALVTGVGWLVALVFLAPYLQMLLTALKPQPELMKSPPTYLPSTWEWANFVEVWKAAPIATNLKVSLIVASASTLITLAAALPAAYYTARNRFRGRTAFLLLVLVTQMFAPTALVVGIYREMLAFGLVNTYTALILVNAAFNLPFSIWILNGYFASIPAEIEEAALLDGCDRFTALTRISLPLALPGVVTAVIYTFISAWNEYVVALTLSSTPDKQPITVAIPSFVTQYHEQWQYLFATSLIAIVPVVVLFAFIERYLIGGLTAGSIK